MILSASALHTRSRDWLTGLRLRWLAAALAGGLIGFILNGFPVRLQGVASLQFGGVLTMCVAILLGPVYGSLAAAIEAGRALLRGHGYGLISAVATACVVGLLVRKRPATALSGGVYWAGFGIPLIVILGLRWQSLPELERWATLMILPINGLLDVAIGILALHLGKLAWRLNLPAAPVNNVPLRATLTAGLLTAAILPLASVLVQQGRGYHQSLQQQQRGLLREAAAALDAEVSEYLGRHLEGLRLLASVIADQQAWDPQRVNGYLRVWH